MLLLITLFALLAGLLTHADGLTTAEDQRGLFGVGSLAGVFSALVGVLLVTGEYRFGTIRPTFLFTPRRSRVICAKLAASLLAGVAFGVAGEALGFTIGYICLRARSVPVALHGGSLALLLLGTVAGVALFGGIGVGVAAIVRNQIGTIIGLFAWGFIVENLLFAFVPSVGRYSPNRAENALEGLTTKHLLPAAAGGAVLLLWAAALTIAGIVATARRDVT
jgi:ABC-type transport system involved in multi-copper enzyme maturation permease subunit